MVTYDPSAPVYSQCMTCKTQLCTKCYQGKYNKVACGPCGSWIVERFAIPKELYVKHHQKKKESDPKQLPENKTEEINGDSDSNLSVSLFCGQPRAKMTVVEQVPHREGSLLFCKPNSIHGGQLMGGVKMKDNFFFQP